MFKVTYIMYRVRIWIFIVYVETKLILLIIRLLALWIKLKWLSLKGKMWLWFEVFVFWCSQSISFVMNDAKPLLLIMFMTLDKLHIYLCLYFFLYKTNVKNINVEIKYDNIFNISVWNASCYTNFILCSWLLWIWPSF